MTHGFSLPPVEPESPVEQHSLLDDVRNLVEDGKTLAEAEIAYQVSRARAAGSGAGGIAGLIALALALVFFALMAMVFGAVIGLAPLLTIWGATAAVMLALLLGAFACLVTARNRWRRLARLLSDDAGDAA